MDSRSPLPTWSGHGSCGRPRGSMAPRRLSRRCGALLARHFCTPTAIAQIERGELTVAAVPGQEMDRVQKMPNVELFRVPSLGMIAYWYNQRHPYLKDKRVRQAFDFALDKEAIRKAVN